MTRIGAVSVALKSIVAVLATIAVAGCHVSGAPAAQTVPITPPMVTTGAEPAEGATYVRQMVVSTPTPTTPSPATYSRDDG